MKRFITRATILVVLTAVGLGLFATTASAQGIYYRSFPAAQYRNPSFIPTTLQTNQFRQFAYNTAFLGRTYSRIPPYLLGYNPYPQVANYGPVYPYPSYPIYPTYPVSPVYPTPYSSPYVNPYATPYAPVSSPYSGYVSPY